MSEGSEIVRKALEALLSAEHTKETLKKPVQQVSKFEGWLKIELANQLSIYSESIQIEPRYKENSKDDYRRADISFISLKSGERYFVELKNIRNFSEKQPKENWKRTMKDPVGVDSDIKKIDPKNNNEKIQGIVAFVIFPCYPGWNPREILDRIKNCPNSDDWHSVYIPIDEKTGFVFGVFEPTNL